MELSPYYVAPDEFDTEKLHVQSVGCWKQSRTRSDCLYLFNASCVLDIFV